MIVSTFKYGLYIRKELGLYYVSNDNGVLTKGYPNIVEAIAAYEQRIYKSKPAKGKQKTKEPVQS